LFRFSIYLLLNNQIILQALGFYLVVLKYKNYFSIKYRIINKNRLLMNLRCNIDESLLYNNNNEDSTDMSKYYNIDLPLKPVAVLWVGVK